ncbi:nitrogenase cofactor biosynthesis protein NifB [Thalassolituus sp.]|jgi:nitrogen fixation protein NifB|uniref:nitrogenase cofactor biosynthesis protein NifB n=1 Tax=Thalassolituus sp. TaxID=2030822 RepID=UPI002A822C39|nr:nitrogenase cofactor biosynthesis protein NifB [Thalassolituus sp.]|tara:strand:- start:18867 stop:20384 length:1518 start_codon:yes stop_codon:yes gene_type:complete
MQLTVLDQETAHSEEAASSCASGSCGSDNEQMAHLSDEIRDKVKNHPCYSEEAHHYFARMHVAVAPACNIQCHYCNRKYDCSNESRPGVVSEVLTPDEAVMKTKAVAANIPQMTVLGIAGPGDPLANPERTFDTFRRLSEEAPDIKLCVSTNGLALPDVVDELAKHNIDHVTITINCVDPKVGAKIYPWIYWNNKRIYGEKAAKILIAQQQKGLEMLVARGILVKVNSVMIPGVNDEHLKEVSRIVKEKGAFLHNVMPLISEPEHGTFYGIMGQRGPEPEELQDLQDSCSGDMNMMRHCRQCRADAVGLLGEDRGEEFTLDKIAAMDIDYNEAMKKRAVIHAGILEELDEKDAKRARLAAMNSGAKQDKPAQVYRPVLMAVATSGGGLINQHFGHATEFLIYEVSANGVRFVSHRKVDQYCIGNDTCGEKESALAGSIRSLKGCEAVLCSKIGFEPWSLLEEAGVIPNGEHAMEPIEEAVQAVYQEMIAAGKLDEVTAKLEVAAN